jgi:hypothetical protein
MLETHSRRAARWFFSMTLPSVKKLLSTLGRIFVRCDPNLKPWKLDEGIWSTNQPFPDGSLFGQGSCMYSQAVPGRMYNGVKSLVESDSYYLNWQCTGCATKHQVKMARRPVTFLGAGLLERGTWTAYGQPIPMLPNGSAAELKEI